MYVVWNISRPNLTVSIAISTDEKVKGKGPVESEGFMNALSSQAAKMKEKKRKISKVS